MSKSGVLRPLGWTLIAGTVMGAGSWIPDDWAYRSGDLLIRPWTLLSHLVKHSNCAHAAANTAGFMATLVLFPASWQPNRPSGFRALALASCMMSFLYVAAVALITPGPVWGASGWLHGWFVVCLLCHGLSVPATVFRSPHTVKVEQRFQIMVLMGLAAKLMIEALVLQSPGVAWQLHLIGSVAGALSGWMFKPRAAD